MNVTKTVLVGVDGSDSSRLAARRAAEVASALGAQLRVLVAVDSSMGDGAADSDGHRMTAGEVAERIAMEVAQSVSDVLADVQTDVWPGKPAEALVEEAERLDAELIVVGNRRAQGLARVLGSVASAVVSHAPCDVYIVKTV